jgi:MHS family alpha-ketoglutarate permease-like MFS transporter
MGTDTFEVATTSDNQKSNRRALTLVGGSIGHFIEWYDWTIYGLLAGVFASQLFPTGSVAASLMASFAVFAIGFVARPIGAFILSPMADKYGRRALLAATIIMSGLGSLIIGLCPTYAQVGIAAPLIIIAARLLQGFSSGGEFQIALTFLNEHANPKRRALSASPQMISIGASVLVANGVASITTLVLDADVLTSWGWRIPFVLGGILSLYGFYIRRGLEETPAFTKIQDNEDRTSISIITSLVNYPREAITVFVVQMNTVQYYLWLIFLPTYAHLIGGLDRSAGFAANMIATLIYCIAVPFFADISDRIGRKPLLIASAGCFLVFSYPLLSMLMGTVSFGGFIFVAISGAIFLSLNNAVIGTVFAELFPTRVRTSGIGIPYAICAAIFGGTAPMVATWLHGLGGPLYISAYIMLICAVSTLIYLFVTPETFRRSLD